MFTRPIEGDKKGEKEGKRKHPSLGDDSGKTFFFFHFSTKKRVKVDARFLLTNKQKKQTKNKQKTEEKKKKKKTLATSGASASPLPLLTVSLHPSCLLCGDFAYCALDELCVSNTVYSPFLPQHLFFCDHCSLLSESFVLPTSPF